MIDFFTKDEERAIINAIMMAEKRTSGEIRVHLEKKLQRPILEEAARVFHKLKMDATAERNGVLILLVPEEKSFCVIGDKGIDEKVSDTFWDEERDLMQGYFREGKFAEGLSQAIVQIGEKLKEHFPVSLDDENELSDEISYGS